MQTEGPVALEDAEEGQGVDCGPPGEPSLGAIMAAIQDLKGSLVPKQNALMVDITLLRADLKKVTATETDIARLQSTSK
ncbi:hypothetical protein NDU88_001246 [Pleurodeles waltl]|uniref:Uncharacterized protein n=1 Tax=Pleurodeles waltl TaxID=8319 RepID=A0AAV7V937_PLEWA|nr:hypothetical protein NDU88_001246 [Pleurodeles waltl]